MRIAFEVSKMFAEGDGRKADFDDVAEEVSYSEPAPHPMIANDPYSDANTKTW